MRGVNSKGFTLIELVLVITLVALILMAAVAGISKMKESSDVGKLNNEINRVVQGIQEYFLLKKSVPQNSEWPLELDDFVDNDIRSRYSYACNDTTDFHITITTTYRFDFDPVSKIVGQGLCVDPNVTESHTAYNADGTVSCTPSAIFDHECS